MKVQSISSIVDLDPKQKSRCIFQLVMQLLFLGVIGKLEQLEQKKLKRLGSDDIKREFLVVVCISLGRKDI